MANTYRMVQIEPFKVNIEMQTVAGWIIVDSAQTIPTAKEMIKQRKDKENWEVKVYDEAGDLVEVRPSPNQPLQDA